MDGHVLAFEYFGGVPGRVRYDNLEAGGGAGAARPGPDRIRAVRGVAFALRLRLVLLPAGHRGRSREGRGGRRDRPVPPPASGSRARRGVAGRAEPVDRRRRHRRRRPASSPAGAITVAAASPTSSPPGAAARLSRSTRPRLLAARVDTTGPGVGAPELLLGPGPLCSAQRLAVRLGADSVEVLDGSQVVARHAAPPERTPRSWSWTTTWRSWAANRAPCPAPPRWPGPGRPGRSATAHEAVLERGPPPAGRRRRHPGVDRGPAGAPHPARSRGGSRDDQGPRSGVRRSPGRGHRRPPQRRPTGRRRSSRSAR